MSDSDAVEPPSSPPSVAAAVAPRRRGRGSDVDLTRQQLVDGAFSVLRTEGFRGATARAIAGAAQCNQAAIYYHFGRIEPLLLLALATSSHRRLERYQEVLSPLASPLDLLDALEQLHEEDVQSGHLTVMVELVGGITAQPELRSGITEAIGEWVGFVAETIARATGGTVLGPLVPAVDLADMVFALVLGIELQNKLDGRTDRYVRIVNLARLALFAMATGGPDPA